MRILLAEDDTPLRVALTRLLAGDEFEPIPCSNGQEALEVMTGHDSPPLAVLDWGMPLVDGISVCTRVRDAQDPRCPPYMIVLTARSKKPDIVRALDAGADDFVSKPYDNKELMARVHVGRRTVESMFTRLREIRDGRESAYDSELLQELWPICGSCGKLHKDDEYLARLRSYLGEHPEVEIQQRLCADCEFGPLQEPAGASA